MRRNAGQLEKKKRRIVGVQKWEGDHRGGWIVTQRRARDFDFHWTCDCDSDSDSDM